MIFNHHALTALREARGLSKAALGRADGTSASYITRLEGGARTNPSINTVVNLARALGVDPQALFFDPDPSEILDVLVASARSTRAIVDLALDLLERVRSVVPA